MYALCAPHGSSGVGNNGFVIELAGRKVLLAERKGTWLADGHATVYARFLRLRRQERCWTDLAGNYQMIGNSIARHGKSH